MKDLCTTLASLARARQSLLEQELEQVVNVNSHTGNPDGIESMLTWFQARMARAGLTGGGRVVGTGGREHLVLRRPRPGAPRVLLVGHVDTVFPIDHPFQRFERRGPTAHGPGVSDMKGGLLVAAHTLELLAEIGRLDDVCLTAFINSDEETQSKTSRQLLYTLCEEHFDVALVFEGGRKNGNVVTARKGVGAFVIQAHGVGAHAGISHADGVNAIAALSHKVLAMERLTDYERGVTVNTGRIQGGVSRNTVAPSATAEFDVRVERPEDMAPVQQAIERLAGESQMEGARVELSGEIGRPPWAPNAASDALARCWSDAASQLGLEVGGQATGGGSDGNHTFAAGIPTLDALGPVGGNPHTPDEYIEIESLSQRAALNALAIVRWLDDHKAVAPRSSDR